jgi:serine/threonine-protein kinase
MLRHGRSQGGRPFIVMELLAGQSLEELLEQQGKLAPPMALGLLRQVADALDAAHACGIVHRDIKPENILMCTERNNTIVKVLDFGLAKPWGVSGHSLTQTGILMGTPYFMSPEQLVKGGKDIDSRADMWALAAVAYRVLTGEQPFEGDSLHALVFEILKGNYRPMNAVAGPPSLEPFFQRAFRVDREERFNSAGELVEELARRLGIDDEEEEVNTVLIDEPLSLPDEATLLHADHAPPPPAPPPPRSEALSNTQPFPHLTADIPPPPDSVTETTRELPIPADLVATVSHDSQTQLRVMDEVRSPAGAAGDTIDEEAPTLLPGDGFPFPGSPDDELTRIPEPRASGSEPPSRPPMPAIVEDALRAVQPTITLHQPVPALSVHSSDFPPPLQPPESRVDHNPSRVLLALAATVTATLMVAFVGWQALTHEPETSLAALGNSAPPTPRSPEPAVESPVGTPTPSPVAPPPAAIPSVAPPSPSVSAAPSASASAPEPAEPIDAAAAAANLAHLTVTCSPACIVLVDGRPLGASPLTKRTFGAGPHKVSGYRNDTGNKPREVMLAPGAHVTLHIDMYGRP